MKKKAPVTLNELTRLANRQLELEAQVAALQHQLDLATKQLNIVRCDLLPAALADAGANSFTLASGHKVELSTDYTCSLGGKNREAAAKWLRSVNLQALITCDVVEQFSLEDTAQLEKLRKVLQRAGIPWKENENVINTGTFKAVVRERLAAGDNIPIADFGMIELNYAKITPPKKPVQATKRRS